MIKTPYGIGTGFFVNEYGYIVTNYHVIVDWRGSPLNAQNIEVQTRDGRKYNVVMVDAPDDFDELDIAILKINQKVSNYLPFKPDEASVGEEVVAIGHPNSDFWNQSKGIISKINTSDKYILQTDVPIDEGNSGGPLINGKGQVVGIVTGAKIMYDSRGNLKIQETGKIAIKATAVKYVLNKRKIKYYQNPIVYEGTTEYERQFDQLQKDKEELTKDREALRQERAKFEKDRSKFIQEKQEALSYIEKAELIKKEINRGKELNEKKWKELVKREEEIEKKEKWIKDKEAMISRKLVNRFALEILIEPGYIHLENSDSFNENVLTRGSDGLFYRFGFDRDYYGDVLSSDRVGLVYGIQKFYNIKNKILDKSYNHDISFAIEFSDIFRLGFGRNLSNEFNYYGYKNYNFAYVNLNFNGYPIPIGLNFSVYTDNTYNFKTYVLGFYSGLALSFFRF
ncbi:MAG: trypsin-like peptidase domain-containing protein [Bacteroidota bacterium]